MANDPKREYITGVLFPTVDTNVAESAIQVENEAEVPVDNSSEGEDEQSDMAIGSAMVFSPALNPSMRPPSMGISFEVKSSELRNIDLCATWAIYMKGPEGARGWNRRPAYKTCTFTAGVDTDEWLDYEGKNTEPSAAEISINVRNRSAGENRTAISVFLVNRRRQVSSEFAKTEECVFQPQLRLVLPAGMESVSGKGGTASDEEEKRLEFLYRRRTAPARGHMCSAVWKEIDPEHTNSWRKNEDPDSAPGPPFAWVDGQILPEKERQLFTQPDLRTDFVPVYSIPAPDFKWREEFGPVPQLYPKVLAECWNPGRLKDALTPLATAYDRWISIKEEQHKAHLSGDEGYSGIITSSIEELRKVSARIRKGIEFLCRNEDARLAFCFSNRAIYLQSCWPSTKGGKSHGNSFPWRPFQLAFLLMSIESIANGKSTERDVCDLLWVPTGAGKTEAYLASIIFMIAYRRRRAILTGNVSNSDGVSVITRYTLRLLTIQQFRRLLKGVTAAEYLRVSGLGISRCTGWHPADYTPRDDFIWGTQSFSAGMWVGSGVSPNRLTGNGSYPGAIELLIGPESEVAEPAQVIRCPACDAYLAIPPSGLPPGKHSLHFVCQSLGNKFPPDITGGPRKTTFRDLDEVQFTVRRCANNAYCIITLDVNVNHDFHYFDVRELWGSVVEELRKHGLSVELQSASAVRMGYFLRYYLDSGNRKKKYDFDIICPSPDCPLSILWCACTPSGSIHDAHPEDTLTGQDMGNLPGFEDARYIDVQLPFRAGSRYLSDRIRIPAMTVDDQIYQRLPTVLVSTIDKFARLPFEPKTSCLFGNVEYHHPIYGYYRLEIKDGGGAGSGHPVPSGRTRKFYRQVGPLSPPDVILQDELHLIDGPLGSLAAIYETVIDRLISEAGASVKYIASTATIRRASAQVYSAFHRKLQLFPPHGTDSDDRFFIIDSERQASDDTGAGRLYVGICSPGQGALTPLSRIWARLLQSVWERRNATGSSGSLDNFWTLTGYFNSVRELGGAMALYRQDIPDRINELSTSDRRNLSDEKASELSSRTSSTNLPSILDILGLSYPDPNASDVLFTTSMFGTGVDIPRLGLMVVNGQPKTTSAYIQSTGRVGRNRAALVVTLLRATRPRDLSHYEFFCGYHRRLHRYVEPVTINPFAKGTTEKAAGPLCVALLRNMRGTTIRWADDKSAPDMAALRTTAAEVDLLPKILENRAETQPADIRPPADATSRMAKGKLDEWQQVAALHADLKYVEYAILGRPKYPVVLGDPQHQNRLPVVFRNAPQSLRDIEETTGFQT